MAKRVAKEIVLASLNPKVGFEVQALVAEKIIRSVAPATFGPVMRTQGEPLRLPSQRPRRYFAVYTEG
ncbi:hypothetical protein RvY_06800 [Ramazzottius varieornatus]|uniref:Uncharacterized protein n=1 Tax=Ramazzottius varieornatus TaxID=947166 RepID=A0A1D1V361_RAMVA|nr:hypothetical protein RvY_06800 [Ramazzottius varieornatus]